MFFSHIKLPKKIHDANPIALLPLKDYLVVICEKDSRLGFIDLKTGLITVTKLIPKKDRAKFSAITPTHWIPLSQENRFAISYQFNNNYSEIYAIDSSLEKDNIIGKISPDSRPPQRKFHLAQISDETIVSGNSHELYSNILTENSFTTSNGGYTSYDTYGYSFQKIIGCKNRFLSLHSDGSIKLWNLENGNRNDYQTILTEGSVQQVEFTPSGKIAIILSKKGNEYLIYIAEMNEGMMEVPQLFLSTKKAGTDFKITILNENYFLFQNNGKADAIEMQIWNILLKRCVDEKTVYGHNFQRLNDQYFMFLNQDKTISFYASDALFRQYHQQIDQPSTSEKLLNSGLFRPKDIKMTEFVEKNSFKSLFCRC